MNIFVLDKDIDKIAEYHVTAHINKMITESVQMLCYVHYQYCFNRLVELGYKHLDDVPATDEKAYEYYIYCRSIPYKISYSHLKHPCTKWIYESLTNYEWIESLVEALNKEFKYRTNKPDDYTQKACLVMRSLPRPRILDMGPTAFVQAMPEKYRQDDVVEAYRDYYVYDKEHLLKYTKRDKPEWMVKRLKEKRKNNDRYVKNKK